MITGNIVPKDFLLDQEALDFLCDEWQNWN